LIPNRGIKKDIGEELHDIFEKELSKLAIQVYVLRNLRVSRAFRRIGDHMETKFDKLSSIKSDCAMLVMVFFKELK